MTLGTKTDFVVYNSFFSLQRRSKRT